VAAETVVGVLEDGIEVDGGAGVDLAEATALEPELGIRRGSGKQV
jgi:hypothetical protein